MMRRLVCHICFSWLGLYLSVGIAHAQSCPDYFRFVDFGTIDAGGAIVPGGPIFRVAADDQTLLAADVTSCLDVAPLYTDGHNRPMPVVKSIGYAPDRVAPALKGLSVTRTSDTAARLAAANAMVHQVALEQGEIDIITGADFLCASIAYDFTKTISCEVQNPFEQTAPLVVYCDETRCTMPVMAIDADMIISADWTKTGPDSAAATGEAAATMVDHIHTFIGAQMSR